MSKKTAFIAAIFVIAGAILIFVHTRSSQMSESDVVGLRADAENGDLEAAKKLWFYYGFIKFNEAEFIKWLTFAANAGDSASQHNLAGVYIYSKAHRDLEKARFWLKKSADGGNEAALIQLGEIAGAE